MKKTILITGATSGVGKATAEILASENHQLIICGRRIDRLQSLEKTLSQITEVHSLSFDVSSKAQVDEAIASLPDDFKNIDVLINNAGNAHGMDLFHEADVSDWEAMIDINLKGLLYVSRAILPNMVKKKSGHVINIGSIAGIEAYPKGGVYNASKFAVHGLTQSLRQDLNPHNIKVSEIMPGLVNTEFSKVRFKGDENKASKVYEGMTPLSGQDIAEIISFIISRPPHVNLAETLVLPLAQATATMVNRQ